MQNEELLTLETITKIDEQILFNVGREGIFVGRIVEIREKALKVDYTIENCWGQSRCIVFNYCTWMPKSVLEFTDPKKGLTVKTWFARNFKGGNHIKRYFMTEGRKVEC